MSNLKVEGKVGDFTQSDNFRPGNHNQGAAYYYKGDV